MKIYYQLYIL